MPVPASARGGVCVGEGAQRGPWGCRGRRGCFGTSFSLLTFLAQGCAGRGNGPVGRSCSPLLRSVPSVGLGGSRVGLMLIHVRTTVTHQGDLRTQQVQQQVVPVMSLPFERSLVSLLRPDSVLQGYVRVVVFDLLSKNCQVVLSGGVERGSGIIYSEC